MRKVSTDLLFKDIENTIKQRNSTLLAERKASLDEATRRADQLRAELQAQRKQMEEVGQRIERQSEILAACQRRRETLDDRRDYAVQEYHRAQERLKSAQESFSAVRSENARLAQRYDALALSAPRDDSNYDAHLRAYEQQVENIDNEIDRLTQEIKTLKLTNDDAATNDVINALYLQASKLRGEKAALSVPVEDTSIKEARARHFAHMEEIRAELVALEKQERDCQAAESQATSELSRAENNIQNLQNEPERDRLAEKAAKEEIGALKEELKSIPPPPTAAILTAKLDEERASVALEAVEAEVAAESDEAKARFESSALVSGGEWESLSQLTTKRTEAEKLWNQSVKEELEQIKTEVVPTLDWAKERAAELEQTHGQVEISQHDYLTPEEEHVLATTFTPEQRAFLEQGGGLKVTATKGLSEWFFYLSVGTTLAALGVSMAGMDSELSVPVLTGFVLVAITTAVIIRLLRLRSTVRMKRRDGTGTPYIEVPYSARNYRDFQRAQVKKMDLDERIHRRALVADARRQAADAQTKYDDYLAQNFPDSSRTSPLAAALDMEQPVEHWYEETLRASLGEGEWPSVELDRLRPRKKCDESKHDSRTRNRWESLLKERGLTEFLR